MADSAADEKLRKELRPRALVPDAALSLAKKHFGNILKDKGDATVERELDSYDDRNYLLTTGLAQTQTRPRSPNPLPPSLATLSREPYTLLPSFLCSSFCAVVSLSSCPLTVHSLPLYSL
jgi:hypothetical protein